NVQFCLWIIDSGCSKHMMGNHALLTNFVKKFLGTVRFGNNDFAMITGYGDVVIGSMTINKVYYVEGDHSLNLYAIALNDIASNSSACLLEKASLSRSWLWHQHLSHLNFATINNLVTSNLVQGDVFHEIFELFQEESSSSSLNDDVQQSLEELMVPSTNTQSISNNMVPNVNEAISSHNVFNERLEDTYFDASTTLFDPSNVHTFYQPYPHEKKWTKDHP
nr:integrase, catalytic region, zinc finger, CCHC-type, peptidase aspartic, catalytic [Tanacetum cinerariifolium]